MNKYLDCYGKSISKNDTILYWCKRLKSVVENVVNDTKDNVVVVGNNELNPNLTVLMPNTEKKPLAVSLTEKEKRELGTRLSENKKYSQSQIEFWIYHNYSTSSLMQNEICSKLDITNGKLRYIIRKYDLSKRDKSQNVREFVAWAIVNFNKRKETIKEITEKFGITKRSLYNQVNLLNLKENTNESIKEWVLKNSDSSKELLKKIALKEGMCIKKVTKALKEVEKETKSETEHWLLNNLKETNLFISEISKKLGISKKEVAHLCRKHKIKRMDKIKFAKKWLKENYEKTTLTNYEIMILLNLNSEELINLMPKIKITEIGITSKYVKLKRLNEKSLPIKYTFDKWNHSHYKTNYPKLYNFFKKDYCGKLDLLQIAYKFNIQTYFLEHIMVDLNVDGYHEYNLSMEQIKWIKNDFHTFYEPFNNIFKLELFEENDKKEFNRFIKEK